MKITLPEAMAQLEDYDADEVADLLRLAGKTGNRHESLSCPIANYLHDVVGSEVYVNGGMAWIAFGPGTTTPVPPGVWAFVEAFDNGVYPDLVFPEEDQ